MKQKSSKSGKLLTKYARKDGGAAGDAVLEKERNKHR